jgi:hypothetical protein
MGTNSDLPGWSLLLIQLPASPSSVRVTAWRRLREAGATRLLNGAWILPGTEANIAFFEKLRQMICERGGAGYVISASRSADIDETIIQSFRGDRGREYDEFEERCGALLTEISKETATEKFTFAELEEAEQEIAKLTRWQRMIKSRDFFPDERWPRSVEMIDRCRSKLQQFAWSVYTAEGVPPVDGETEDDAADR